MTGSEAGVLVALIIVLVLARHERPSKSSRLMAGPGR